MVPFKETKAQEFQGNKHPHHEYSIFDSGARQRIVRYIIENDVDGIDLDDSVDSKAEYHRKGLLKSVASAGVGVIGDVAHGAAHVAASGAKKMATAVEHSTHIDLHTPRGTGADDEKGETQRGNTRALTRRNFNTPISVHHMGNKRVWPCINDFLPLNDRHELNFLVATWAHPRLVIQSLRSRPKRAGTAFDPSDQDSFFGGITAQPTDEIRDYFGEQIALYFAFLRVYTDSLVFPTVIGMLTMVGHLRNGVEGNPLSLAYSILVSFWSVAFIKKWHVRQAELCFLWGTSTFEENEKTRKNFRLKEREIIYEIDEFTGKNEPVPKNPRKIYYRTAASILVGTFFILTVVIAALSAEYVRMLSKPNQLGKYSRVVGSSLNACAILILSHIYGSVAKVLTEWENHRVQTAFEDALIL